MFRPYRPWSALAAALAAATLSACVDEAPSPSAPAQTPASALATCEPLATDAALAALIAGLEGSVDALEADGVLNAGQARALRRHLTNAERQEERGEYCATRDQLQAFRDQLEDLTGEGGLTDRQAYDLRHATRLALSTEVPGPGDPEAYAPGVVGEIRTVSFDGEEVRVRIIDGLAIFNGDIILGFADELGASSSAGPTRSAPCDGCTRWTESIGFSYGDDWGDPATNADMRSRVLEAIDHWRANTAFEFHEQRDNPDLVFRNSMGCSSPVGRRVFTGLDVHAINISTGCGRGQIIHEIGHTVGIFHEQGRGDRDDFVDVDVDAVQEGFEDNFDKKGSAEELGPYDFRSVMHYGCGAFRAADAARDPIVPLAAGITCADLGLRDAMTLGDIAGAYYVNRPQYEIVGISPGAVADRFVATLDWTSEPVDPSYIEWDVIGLGVLQTGPTFSTADAGLANGDYWLWAKIVIGGVWVTSRNVRFTIDNAPPSVDLGSDRTVEANRAFILTAAVIDAEDGACPVAVCSFVWDPVPEADLGGSARYRFASTGPVTIGVTVTDGAGATGQDDVEVTVVDSPPTAFITAPAGGSPFAPGATVPLSGTATDPNWGAGPGDGTLPCTLAYQWWQSSDPTDVLNLSDACSGTITFGDPGTRVLTHWARDGANQISSTAISLVVEGCGASGCAPTISFDFDTPPDLDGSSYTPPFTQPGWLLSTTIEATAGIADDGPGTVSYEWRVQPPCFGGCSDFVVSSGSLIAPNNAFFSWTPSDDVTEWGNCALVPLPYVISLRATDGAGNTRVYSRTVYLGCDFV